MIPNYIILLECFPITSNGKIDQSALRKLAAQSRTEQSDNYYPAASNLEQQLINIWQKVLKVNKIGIKDHFFKLGGNSLKAASIINHIQEQIHADVDFNTFLNNTTIMALAKEIEIKSWLNQNQETMNNKSNQIEI
jgi:surfactin family lipopeptide synthetase A